MRYIVSHLTRPTTRTWPPAGLRYKKIVESEKLSEINENILDLSLDRLESNNHETDKNIRTGFGIEKKIKIAPHNNKKINGISPKNGNKST